MVSLGSVAIICASLLAMVVLLTHKGIVVKVKTEVTPPSPPSEPIRAKRSLFHFGRPGHPTVVDDEHEVYTAKEDRSVKTHFSEGLEDGFEGEGWD